MTLTYHAKNRMDLRVITENMIKNCLLFGKKENKGSFVEFVDHLISVLISNDKIITVKPCKKVSKAIKQDVRVYGMSRRKALYHYFYSHGAYLQKAL